MSKKNNRETTFRFPFDIDTRYFLGLALFFFILSIKPVNEFLFSKLTIPKLKSKIEKDIHEKLARYQQIIKDTSLVSHAFSNSLSDEEFLKLEQLPFSIYFYDHHEIVLWNTIQTKNPPDTFRDNKALPYSDSNGFYVAYQSKVYADSSARNIVALFKIKNENVIENKYFTRNFPVDDKENDFNLELTYEKVPKSVPIIVNNEPQFYISENDDFIRVNDKNGWRLFLSALPFILFGVSIHTYFKVEIKKKNIQLIFSLLLLTIALIRVSNYLWGFPIDYEQYGLFSPEYFASDGINRSLGDLFINMCLMFWALLFFIINVQGKVYDLANYKYKAVIGVILFLITIMASLYLSDLVYRITRDSVINFDTTLFYKLDIFSFVGILTFMLIFVNFVYVAIIARNYLEVCFSVKYIKYILVALAWILFMFINTGFEYGVNSIYVFICVAALYLMQDLNYLKTKFDFNSYKLLIWMLYISAVGALYLTVLIGKKELIDRESYAERLLAKDIGHFEDILKTKVQQIEADSVLKNNLQSAQSKSDISYYLLSKYFEDESMDYEVTVNTTVDKNNTIVTSHIMTDTGAVYSEKIQTDTKDYRLLPQVKIPGDGICKLEIRMSRRVEEAVNEYADLLLSKNSTDMLRKDIYSYAVYRDSTLIERKGNHIFPYKYSGLEPQISKSNTAYASNRDYSEFWMQNEDGKSRVVVVKSNNSLYLFTTLFAYIFFIYFVTISLYILGNIIARSNLIYKRFINLLSINLRLRIHFSILLVELCSFIVIGYFTSFFLIRKVNEKMKDDLSKYSYSIQKESKNNIFTPDPDSAKAGSSVQLNAENIAMIKSIADRYSININLYNLNQGKLLYSSLPELYKREVLSDRLAPDIFHQLKKGYFNNTICEEKVGLLKFLSSYFVIRNSAGKDLGIVQLPFFLSNSEIRSETTTIITTLINIYIFVFLISAIIAFFLTKSVTRPFTYIVKQFTKINLSKTNEPLKWFDSDEIGLLIKEYNRMLRKLENSTVLLAKTEREMAWREMAKQVAHEIKNPLTPMKLSLQMLERAIKNNASNVNETAIKVTKTLVEQIDNLSIIATNFSNFAKLPVSKKEVFPLNEFLYSVTGMYHDDNNNEFLFMIPDYEIKLYADKSQIMRVFTNIIQNAIQAIPEDRKGNIALTVSKIKNNHIRISISDNGEGITEEKGKSLFQPYFTTKTSGTGLGLAMCKDIIEESGGKISFESEEEEGTIFHIDLPIFEEE